MRLARSAVVAALLTLGHRARARDPHHQERGARNESETGEEGAEGDAGERTQGAQRTADDGSQRPPGMESVDDGAAVLTLDLECTGVHRRVHDRVRGPEEEESDGKDRGDTRPAHDNKGRQGQQADC